MGYEQSGFQTYRHILSSVFQWPEIVLHLWKIRAWAHPCSHLHSRWFVHVPGLTQQGSGLLPWLLVPPTAIIHTQTVFQSTMQKLSTVKYFPLPLPMLLWAKPGHDGTDSPYTCCIYIVSQNWYCQPQLLKNYEFVLQCIANTEELISKHLCLSGFLPWAKIFSFLLWL